MGPTLSQVLSTQSTPAASLNLFFLAAGLLASLVAVVSVAKRSEIFKGKQTCLEDTHYQEKTAKLSFMLDELKLEKESVVEQNHELRNQLTSLSAALYDLRQKREEREKIRVMTKTRTIKAKKEAAGRKPRRVSRKKK